MKRLESQKRAERRDASDDEIIHSNPEPRLNQQSFVENELYQSISNRCTQAGSILMDIIAVLFVLAVHYAVFVVTIAMRNSSTSAEFLAAIGLDHWLQNSK